MCIRDRDYATLEQEGMMERSHKQYLNDYFQGYAGNSTSRGELYNADPVTGDARFCGTTCLLYTSTEKRMDE